MKRLAHNIIIKTELKSDFVLDQFGNPTEETYEYREYHVVDEEGVVLEIGKYFTETTTVEDIVNSTGIAFGISAWFVS
jgi:hypothetical protein